ncbi:hypothetical protein CP975_28915 [Streptomyces alboniger]|uniref:Uncharacterized protein n=1 Tax=Streptomyces alboniger TaxID=132473 RepID=A0A5J6HL52_STRAD|nr:hypothetical protein CP975_28915 [Streptomyces alboniger]
MDIAAGRFGCVTSRARWTGFCDADLPTPVTAVDDGPVGMPARGRWGGRGESWALPDLSVRASRLDTGVTNVRSSYT